MKYNLLLIVTLIVLPISCNKDNESDANLRNKGNAPQDIIGEVITLYNTDGSTLLSISHFVDRIFCTSKNNVDYTKYPPSYKYEVVDDNIANYCISITEKVYMPNNNDYQYCHYLYDFQLLFTSKNRGTFMGTQTNGENETTHRAGTFVIGMDNDESDDGGTDDSGSEKEDDNQHQDGIIVEYSDSLYLSKIKSGYDVAQLLISYTHPESYYDKDDCITAGVCCSPKKHPTITDTTSEVKIIRHNNNSFTPLYNLKPATTYYIRPFSRNKNVVTYYKETTFTTLGGDLDLKIKHIEGNTIECYFNIQRDGLYDVDLIYWGLYYDTRELDIPNIKLDYLTKGSTETFQYTWHATWYDTDYFVLEMYDIINDRYYNSDKLFKPN